MATQFTREQMKVCVAKMCLTIGWHSSMTTPIEILTDILCNYLFQLGKATNDYASGFGMTEPNLDHLGLAFRDFHVNRSELEEYIKNVDAADSPSLIPKYPLPKEDHLNFLKPGSKEVVTRQVHIHEHLPPMHPVLEASESEAEAVAKKEKEDSANNDNMNAIFKRPSEVSQNEPFKRPRLLMEEEGRPTREISSVMMTTSGFLSPAREGKLPEARTPLAALEPSVPPPPVLPVPPEPITKKPLKMIKRLDKKKDRIGRELFKPLPDHPNHPIKKVTNAKDIVKSKMKTTANANAPGGLNNNFMLNNDLKISLIPENNKVHSPNQTKFNKALAAARLKTERLNTTITPIPPKPIPPPVPIIKSEPHVDKLFTEPDKRKINILKKISVKNEKVDKVIKVKEEIKPESSESSPDLIIDESANEIPNKIHHLSNDITIELVDPNINKNPEKVEFRNYFDNDSRPGTPCTPKTPEMVTQSSPLNRVEKRKRKDKSKIKKLQKQITPVNLDVEPIDTDMERPKTPEAAHLLVKHEKQDLPTVSPSLPFPFFSPFAGPGLIPSHLGNPLFTHLPIPPLNIPTFGQPPYMPPVHPGMPLNFMPPIKQEEFVPKPPPVEKPSSSINITLPVEKESTSPKGEKKSKEHKKDKKDKLKKKNKKDKIKNKAEKKKLKEEKKDKEKIKKEKKEKRKEKEIREGEISVPKLTLKLGSASPHPDSSDTRKLNIKPIIKKEEHTSIVEPKREMSPELAKISALVTGQPKPKTSTDNFPSSSNDSFHVKKSMFKPIPKIRTKEIRKESTYDVDLYSSTPSSYIDAEGNTVWICPACSKQDDGSPMIGCDDCDAWYHWVCVGIQVPPDDNEDWYCRLCISKKQEVLQTDKKKKRKKREKKEH